MTLESLEGKRIFRNRRLLRPQLQHVSLTEGQTASLTGQTSRAISSSSSIFKKDRSGVFSLTIQCHSPYRNCVHSVLITAKNLGAHTPQALISEAKCSTIILMPSLQLKKFKWNSRFSFGFR